MQVPAVALSALVSNLCCSGNRQTIEPNNGAVSQREHSQAPRVRSRSMAPRSHLQREVSRLVRNQLRLNQAAAITSLWLTGPTAVSIQVESPTSNTAGAKDAGFGPPPESNAPSGIVPLTYPPNTATTRTISVFIGATTGSGSIPPDVIQRILRQALGHLRQCKATALERKPQLMGRFEVRFNINRNGSTIDVSIAESTLSDSKLQSCVNSGMRRLVFPKPAAGSGQISFPLEFQLRSRPR